jgi:hypothetical protein
MKKFLILTGFALVLAAYCAAGVMMDAGAFDKLADSSPYVAHAPTWPDYFPA